MNKADSRSQQKKKKYATNLKVFVKNLPGDDKVKEIVQLMESCGKVLDAHRYFLQNGGQKFQQIVVVFSSEEEADKATLLTGSLIEGRHIIVAKHRQYAVPSSSTVTVSNLFQEIIEEDIWQFFEECGTIKYIHIDRLLNDQSCRAEIHFKGEGGAKKAMKLAGQELKGSVISVDLAKVDDGKTYPVFVSGLPLAVQKADLMEVFRDCGKIKRIKMKALKGSEIESQKATVFFTNEDSAKKAVKHSGQRISGTTFKVTQRETLFTDQQQNHLNPLYVAGIARETKDVDLFFKFQECGLFEGIQFVTSKKPFLKKCIIQFKEPKSLKKALALKDLSLHGHQLIISDKKDVLLGEYVENKGTKRTAAGTELSGGGESLASPNGVLGNKKRRKSKTSEIQPSELPEDKEEADEPLTSPNGVSEKKKRRKSKIFEVEPFELPENKEEADEPLTSPNGVSEKKKRRKSKTSEVQPFELPEVKEEADVTLTSPNGVSGSKKRRKSKVA